ncbi:hypothetical protein GALL_65700 [mine drainage metagenome]|uniref:Uncharacterized protein n=1 Tax=mine drainage metagenome TaxID=410659 RepID=A0A1J5ST76_9ZZZZ
MTHFGLSISRILPVLLAFLLPVLCALPAHAEDAPHEGESAQILQAFNKQHRETEHAKSITDKDKQRVMFLLGVSLLTLVLITGGLGIAMGLFGKSVFVAHMIFAGLSMTLAVVHAVVALVWFYPF